MLPAVQLCTGPRQADTKQRGNLVVWQSETKRHCALRSSSSSGMKKEAQAVGNTSHNWHTKRRCPNAKKVTAQAGQAPGMLLQLHKFTLPNVRVVCFITLCFIGAGLPALHAQRAATQRKGIGVTRNGLLLLPQKAKICSFTAVGFCCFFPSPTGILGFKRKLKQLPVYI